MQIWCEDVANIVPSSRPRCYADDASATCGTASEVKHIFSLTEEFAALTGMKLSILKCETWATTARLRKALKKLKASDGRLIKHVTSTRLLGSELNFTRQSTGGKHVKKRLKTAETACNRIERLPLPLAARAMLVETTVIPSTSFDCCVRRQSKQEARKGRARCARAIWGKGARFRCNETLFTLLGRGHGCDPKQAEICRTMKATRRMLKQAPGLSGYVGASMGVSKSPAKEAHDWTSCKNEGGPAICRLATLGLPPHRQPFWGSEPSGGQQ